MSTFDQLKAEVVFNTFDGPKYLERSGVYLNNAARDIARRSLWGGNEIAIATDDNGIAAAGSPGFARVTAVWGADANGRKQDRYEFAGDAGAPGAQYDAFGPAGTTPSYRTRTGDGGALTLEVIPVPAARSLVVSGSRLPALMVAGEDVCELGQDAEDALILFARAKLYLREDDKEMYDALMQSYMEELRRFTLSTRPVAEGPRVTPGTWGDGFFGGV